LAACDRHEDALACWKQAIALDPGHSDALYNCARVFMSLERYVNRLLPTTS
jgi:hypothetical protein